MWISKDLLKKKGLDYFLSTKYSTVYYTPYILSAQQQGNISCFSFAREEFTVLMLETLTDK
jgi:hypothetical protein